MTIHLTAVAAKDSAGTAIPGGIDQHDMSGAGTGPNVPATVGIDSAGAEVIGLVTTSPAANTVLGRLKDLLSLIVLVGRNALYAPGTSNSGLLTSAISLQTTELNALANASVIVSSVGGTSGLFTNSNTGQAKVGEIFFTLGTVTTMSAGANLAGWFLQSPDSGTTLESLTVVPPRPPDFIVPLDATTGNKVYKAAGQVRLPALQFKVLVQNNSGQAFTSTGNTLKLAPIAEII